MIAVPALVVIVGLASFALLSRRLRGSFLTGPLLMTAYGLGVGAAGLGLLEFDVSNEAVRLLAEITLILVLFTDAADIDLRQLRSDHSLPQRLLGIGMPLTIGLGALLASLLFGFLNLWEALLLAAILAPTDAALGQAVVSNPSVPSRIRVALNVESGLNDGIALPWCWCWPAVPAPCRMRAAKTGCCLVPARLPSGRWRACWWVILAPAC